MSVSDPFLSPAEAARRLGVSAKALRLYEQRGMLTPLRTEAGWRIYGDAEMTRATRIVALRALGLSLKQIERVLDGDRGALEAALARHQARLEGRHRELSHTVEKVRKLRSELAGGGVAAADELARLALPDAETLVAFDLPWPWGGERFELTGRAALTFITGPLGSGKTRLARKIAEHLPDAAFLDLERASAGGVARARQGLTRDLALKERVERALDWLLQDGAVESPALLALLVGLESGETDALVVDLVEEGLGQSTQEALIAYLRGGALGRRMLFLMSRSSAILDLQSLATGEAILLCPANHSPPVRVLPYPGTPGYEAVATCLAPPAVRARTHGLSVRLPDVP